MRVTVPSPEFATHTDRLDPAMWSAPCPTLNDSTTLSVAGSIRKTIAAASPVTQIEPAAYARPAGAAGTGILAVTAPRAGSIRTTALSRRAADHSAPAPIVRAPRALAPADGRQTAPRPGPTAGAR